ncbi:acyltransferase [Niveibacterium sp. SC-1]|uniref:acyltransferase family protein n=1 Tax=Niveibacterium sp. SC-1 TaxID=3135646 RepID=UPI00311F7E77
MIEGIQYLRAIAALMVVAHHARHFFGADLPAWSSFGARGVDIFFVISGFVIAHVSRGFEPGEARWPQIRAFLVRRFIRVVPLYWLFLLLAAWFLVGWLGKGLLLDLAFLPRHYPLNAAFIAPALLPGWSVNYEIFFYLVFALSLAFGGLRYMLLSAALVGLVVAGWVIDGPAPAWSFYTSPLLLTFLLGVALNHTYRADAPRGRLQALLLVVGGATGLALTGIAPKEARLLMSGLCAAVLVLGAIHLCSGWKCRALLLIGDASYSIYLSHLFTFIWVGQGCRLLGFGTLTPVAAACVITLHVTAATLAGVAVHFLVERPLLAVCKRIWGRLGSVGAALASP